MTASDAFVDLLGLRSLPVAISFCQSAPESVSAVAVPAPSGCSYWKLAAAGQTFFTKASDHFGCPIGAYTHRVDLPADKSKELETVIGMMMQLNYIREPEIPNIPRRDKPFQVAVYSPLRDAPIAPDVVILSGTARQMMILAEAVRAAGIETDGPTMGRPTCAAIPAVLQSNGGAASLGCIGNRVYTKLQDDELYFVLPGKRVAAVTAKLAEIVRANRELEAYHRARTTAAS